MDVGTVHYKSHEVEGGKTDKEQKKCAKKKTITSLISAETNCEQAMSEKIMQNENFPPSAVTLRYVP